MHIQGSDVIDILICRSTDIKSANSLAQNRMDVIVEAAYDAFAWGPKSDGLYYTMPASEILSNSRRCVHFPPRFH